MQKEGTNIYAEKMGYDVFYHLSGKNLSGNVHSVFQNAVNITLLNGYFFTLLDRQYGSIPFGISVHKENNGFLTELGMRAGKDVFIVNDSIFCNGAPFLSFQYATVVRKPDVLLPAGFDTQIIYNNCRYIVQYVLTRKKNKGFSWLYVHFENILDQTKLNYKGTDELNFHAVRILERMVGAYLQEDYQSTGMYLRKLIGLGYGLTPSGDDFLVGFFATLYFATHNSDFNAELFVKLREYVSSEIEGNTTKISEVYLKYALKGEVSELLYSFIRGIYCEREDNLDFLINNMMDLGSSSGIDMILGCLFAFRLIKVTHQEEIAN
jgi:hypothetical protein